MPIRKLLLGKVAHRRQEFVGRDPFSDHSMQPPVLVAKFDLFATCVTALNG